VSYLITGSAYKRAATANRVVLYTASECVGCFDRTRMHQEVAALEPGDSVTYAALKFQDGPADPPPVVITKVTDAEYVAAGRAEVSEATAQLRYALEFDREKYVVRDAAGAEVAAFSYEGDAQSYIAALEGEN
jgi:hypothetical protein